MSDTDWRTRAEAVTDAELAGFRKQICVVAGHFHLNACGSCSRCGGGTPSCSMRICDRCAGELGVCPFDQLMTGWGSVSAPDEEAIAARWLALLMRGYSAERAAARKALSSFPLPGIAAAAGELDQPAGTPTRSPARAEFIVGFARSLPDGVSAGVPFLNGTIVRVNTALGSAVVQTADAAHFETLAAQDPRVRFVELNAPGG
jgi:hypothetical protein